MYISLIFSNLVVANKVITKIIAMHNFVTKFGKILEITKQFAGNLVNEKGNLCRPGPVPKFDYILQSERGKKTFNFKPEEIFRQLRGLFSDMKSIRLQGHSTEKQESKEV